MVNGSVEAILEIHARLPIKNFFCIAPVAAHAHGTDHFLVEEFDVRTWNAETGVLVLTEILLIDEVANISVPEMSHLKGSVPSPVEVLYLLPLESRRLPETIM